MTDRPPLPYDWSEIRHKLQAALPDLFDRLNLRHELPTKSANSIYPRNPMRNDRRAGSFIIWTVLPFAGGWKDYALAGGPGSKGDVFDLIAGCERLQSKIDTYWWAVDWLGLDRKGHLDRPRSKAMAADEMERRERDRIAAEARDAAAGEAKSNALFKLWLSLPPIAGTIAETYLREARRIPLERLPHQPGALRYAEAVEYVDPDGEVHEWRHVMVAAMTRGRQLAALHRTYLKPDGSGKADVAKPKLMIGPVRGAAIRLSSGPSNLSPTKAAKAGKFGPLAIGEGIETCLTVACARPDYRVWAAGSLSLMGLLGWPECASAVVLLGENDWKPEARSQFETVRQHWIKASNGRPVEVVTSAVGSDFNDWAKAG